MRLRLCLFCVLIYVHKKAQLALLLTAQRVHLAQQPPVPRATLAMSVSPPPTPHTHTHTHTRARATLTSSPHTQYVSGGTCDACTATCGSGTYKSASCTASANTVCSTCSTCGSGQKHSLTTRTHAHTYDACRPVPSWCMHGHKQYKLQNLFNVPDRRHYHNRMRNYHEHAMLGRDPVWYTRQAGCD